MTHSDIMLYDTWLIVISSDAITYDVGWFYMTPTVVSYLL